MPLLVVVGAVLIVIFGTPRWLAFVLAALVGWVVASVLYQIAPVVFGRVVGFLAAAAMATGLLTPGGWRWFVALPLGLAVGILWYRWHGSRFVDAIRRDRTLVPFSFDDGNRLVDTLDAVWGSTREGGWRWCNGLRAAHSHGSVVEGTWKRDAECKLENVPPFDCETGTVVARFSNFMGEVDRDDRRRRPHGLALQLWAPGKASFTMVLVDVRRFPVATKEDFITFTNYSRMGGLRLVAGLVWLVVTGRSSLAALLGSVGWRRTKSYTERTYHGLNTFFCDLGKAWVPVRYLVTPAGPTGHAPVATVGFARTRLDDDLQARLGAGTSVSFDVSLLLGRRNDKNLSDVRLRDPRKWWWRASSEPLCKITLDTFVPTEKRDRLFFQPFDVPVGFRASDDEILSARRTAYATSFLRRCPLDEVSK